MEILPSLSLTLAIISGQLIKLPIFANSGATILDIVVFAFCLIGLLKLRFKLKRPPFFLSSALIFIFVASLSLILTPLHLRIQELLISFLYTVRFTLYILLGWVIFSGAFPNLRNHIPQILIFSGLSLAVLGLLQFIILPDLQFLQKDGWDPHYFRTASTFLDPNFAGSFFVLTLLSLFYRGRNMITPRVFLIFAIVYLSLLTTFSRSSYLMFLVSFLTLSYLKRSIKLGILTIILFSLLLSSFQVYIRAVNRTITLDRGQSARLRLSTWQQGLEIFSKNPVLGVGFNAYNFALKQYQLGDEQFLKGKGATTNDSSVLYILSTTGLLGFLAYFSFVVGIIKTKKSILMAAIAGLMVHSIFVNSLFYPFILIWIILAAS